MIRPSTQARVVSATNTILTMVLGVILLAGGGALVWHEVSTPPTHSGHIYFFGSVAVLGAFLIRPDPLFVVIQKLVVIAGQTNIPFIGGRRAGDPPADPNK